MGDEILSHLEIDICFQKSPSDLPESAVNIIFRKLAFPPQIFKCRLQLIS